MKKIKGSKRGLTFTLSSLKIGEKYRYVIDKEHNEILIIPDKRGIVSVSRKKTGKDKFLPLLDIRSKEVKELVCNADYIEIDVRGKNVVVRTFQKAKAQVLQFKKQKTSIFELFGTQTGEIVIPEKMCLVSGMDNYPTSLFGKATLADDSYFEYLSKNAPGFNVRKMHKDIKKVYDVISLFSGAGMFDKAFMTDRFRFVYGVDFDKAACDTYRENIGDHIQCMDIRNVNVDDVPDADVTIGGPCCQAYSNCNRHNMDSEEAEEKRLLVEDYARIVREKKPKVWVVENVPGLLTKDDGYYLDKLCNTLSADYEITTCVVTDCKVGGYSTRQRAIVIGSRIGKIELPKETIHAYKTVKDALDKVDATWFNYNDVTLPREETKLKMSYVPQGGNWMNIPAEIGGYGPNTQSNVMRRLKLDEPAITLTNFRKSNILHPTENRVLTVAEAAAISGLDKNFRFLGRLSDKQQMVANGVTQAIGVFVRDTVLKALDAAENIVCPNKAFGAV